MLLIELREPMAISVGRLGHIAFSKGYYAYVGSALNGIESRVRYHLRKHKSPRWHIDYLLERATISRMFMYETEERLECVMAQALSKEFPSIAGFGSSDCKCHSHLYFDTESERLEKAIKRTTGSPAVVLSPATPPLHVETAKDLPQRQANVGDPLGD